jgi:alkanesulfonate monooxygenase SsuD/methylene tetrahydromethanopterin reductase-like flavin-dependent oxidoreductase (luciferase family)
MREYVEVLRSTYNGERVEAGEHEFYRSTNGFKLAFEPPPYPLRVWLAALGDKMARLAGRIADGVVINMANPARVAQIVDWCHDGANAADRDPSGFQAIAKIRVALHPDEAEARRTLKKVLTFYALQNGYGQMLTDMGHGENVEAIRSAYKAEGFGAARAQVSDEMFDDVPMFAGSSLDGLADRLAKFEEAGATRMIVAYVPSGDDLMGEIRNFINAADFVMTRV